MKQATENIGGLLLCDLKIRVFHGWCKRIN